MKKIYILLVLISTMFTACSSDSSSDAADGGTGPLLRHATTTTGDSTNDLEYLYNGHKLTKIVSDTGLTFEFTYTGNLITTMERVWGEDDVAQRTQYTYDANDRLVKEIFTDYDNGWQETHVYTYNADHTILREDYDGTTVSSASYLGEIKYDLNNANQVIQMAVYENGTWVTKSQMSYSNYNSPLSNVVGFGKLMVNGADKVYATYASVNNVDYPELNYSSVFAYTVNAQNYPTHCVQTSTKDDGSIIETNIDYTYY